MLIQHSIGKQASLTM